jgi:hypothetical protein
MANMMAILRQTQFQHALKTWQKKGELGDILPFRRYNYNKFTHKLAGDSLFLVTVLSNDTLWLVAIYEKTKKKKDVWEAETENQTPCTDITELKKKLVFASGKGIRGNRGELGQELQTPRVLTPKDEQSLRAAVANLTDTATPIGALPEESEPDAAEFPEGKQVYALHARYERDAARVKKAKESHKKKHLGALPCSVCGFDFKAKYGELGEGFAEVHHAIPLADYAKLNKQTTQEKDLVVVCSNCHRMLHRKKPALDINMLSNLLAALK